MDEVSFSELIAYQICMAAQVKSLDNFHPDGFVFKTVLEFFNILIGCFETCLSSLLIKILPIHMTSQALVEIHFSSFFWLVSW